MEAGDALQSCAIPVAVLERAFILASVEALID
jgi:hypothetical protein